jgi:hypothetical protein
MPETCSICGCEVHRGGEYATPTVAGRSHATKHHFVAERFFGRSQNRRGTQREVIFDTCHWELENKEAVFCYDCHEELIHNPVFLPKDMSMFAELVRLRKLHEPVKSDDRTKLAGRIKLLHEVISKGISALLIAEKNAGAKE